MNKLLQLTLAMLMAWSGCFCQLACGFELCEHEHHPGEAACADHHHHHHHDDDQKPEDTSGCEHPEPSERTLPDPPQLVGTPLFVVQEIGEIAWPSNDQLTASRLRGYPPERQFNTRRQAYQAKLCRFLI